MKDFDYPYLYQKANQASIKAQKYYIGGIKVYLMLLVLGALLNFSKPFVEVSIFFPAAIILLIGLILLVVQAFNRYDEIWYNGRAVAESVKTRTFRYMMRSEPYFDEEHSFLQDLKDILNDNKALAEKLSVGDSYQIVSDEMTRVRSLDWVDRMQYYLENRIDEQRSWYAKNAVWNRKQGKLWLSLMIAANGSAVIFSFLFAVWDNDYALTTEPLLVGASAALSWSQAKRFRELGNAYGLTVHEISLIREESGRIKTEDDFSEFVNNSENAFSREHTQWVARRR